MVRAYRQILAAAILAAGWASAAGAAAEAQILGVWLTEGAKSRIELHACGDAVCGTIVWIAPQESGGNATPLDTENEDPALRGRPLIGLRMMTGFTQTAPGEWSDGELYNPDDGESYEPTLTLTGENELEVEACVWFICQSQAWTRAK